MDYNQFLKEKSLIFTDAGFDVETNQLNDSLFDWQKVLVKWALKKGRSALFEDCGLGKTIQSLEWSKHVSIYTGKPVLIVAPLAVSMQTKREGERFGYSVNIAASGSEINPGVNITNYEKLHRFENLDLGGVVLDESSILKNQTGKRRNQIIDTFKSIPYKLCCTATPSPNDYTEIGNTSEFLNIRTMPEMLSMFFINDTANVGDWRLKGHVQKNVFWEWLCSWSIMIRKPSDIGFNNDGFDLPPIRFIEHKIEYTGPKESLFVDFAETMSERREVRKKSLLERCQFAANLVNQSNDQWLVWCDLNDESHELTKRISGAVEIKGGDTDEHKESSILGFVDGKIKTITTKPQIAGFGINMQNCHNMVFVGLSDSYERFYQAVRRCWRFGQINPVNVHIVIEEREGAVLQNIKRKDADVNTMFESMVENMRDIMKQEIYSSSNKKDKYEPNKQIILPDFIRSAA